MNRWLLLDGDFLCHRAFHSTGGLSYGPDATGTIYGFLKALETLQKEHDCNRPVFCFDFGPSIRKTLLPSYKQRREEKRQAMSPEEREAYQAFRRQVDLLRRSLLRRLGYRNVCYARGYEADDIIASILRSLPRRDEVIIVSADRDLFQLLRKRVSIWNPNKKQMLTRRSFEKEFGVEPALWPDVKAMAGCATDQIPGIPGIGEKTAAKFMARKLAPDSKAYAKIVHGSTIWQFNKELVLLPYPGTPQFELREDQLNSQRWQRELERLGIVTIRKPAPHPKTTKSGDKPLLPRPNMSRYNREL